MDEMEKLRNDLSIFDTKVISEKSGVAINTIDYFKRYYDDKRETGTKNLSFQNYQKLRKAVDDIVNQIKG